MMSAREISYDVDDMTMVAYLARPPGKGPAPAVLIGHDGVGLDKYQRARADDLAARGYVVLAMDYHGGQLFFGKPEAMLARVMPLLADVERMLAIGQIALDTLLAEPGVDPDRLFALGYGAGGRIVLELDRAGAPFKAIALVHPGLPDPIADDWTGVATSFLLCTGSEDPLCTPDQVLMFGRALQKAGIDWRANIYGGAEHAFWAKPTGFDGSPQSGSTKHTIPTVPGVSYHPTSEARAWQDVLHHFDETLGVLCTS